MIPTADGTTNTQTPPHARAESRNGAGVRGPILHLVQFSGGITSWATAKRVVERHGTEGVVLLFADTLIEDEDNYRFLHEAAANVGARLEIIADGRTPWEVYRDERFIGNARVDPCSKHLKRKLLDAWRDEHCDPETTTVYVGLNWDEPERLERLQQRVKPWRYEAPLMEKPWRLKQDLIAEARAEGLEPPRMYRMGFSHANCGGFCCKGGMAHFRLLLHHFPERYRHHEEQEARLMEELGSEWGILRDRRGGEASPLTLREFRARLEKEDLNGLDLFDHGPTCGCAIL